MTSAGSIRRLRLTVFVERAEAIGANIHFLLLALIRERALVDVRHKSSIDGVLGVADAVAVHRTLAANIASLCHFKNSLSE